MATKATTSEQASVFSTMLISKRHRRANYALRRRLLLVMKQPFLSWMNLEGFDVFSKVVTLIGSLIFTVVMVTIGGGFSFGVRYLNGQERSLSEFQLFEITADSFPVILVLLIVGAFLTNRGFHWLINRPKGTVEELNTFMISQMPGSILIHDQRVSEVSECEQIAYSVPVMICHG